MAENSKIEWTKHTANLWWGCTKVHEGCDHCYAETLSNRWDFQVWGNDAPRREIKSVWKDFYKYQAAAESVGEIHRVFVGSMMDIFEKAMPLIHSNGEKNTAYTTGHLRYRYFNEIIPATPNLLHLMLTKRPSNIPKMIPESWKENPPRNVMFGTSPCNQQTARNLIPLLLQVKGKKFLSIEPMLGEVELKRLTEYGGSGANGYSWTTNCLNGKVHEWDANGENGNYDHGFTQEEKIDWVIVGGESGHGRRPFNTDWARKIRDDCKQYKTPFFMKQIDKVLPIPDDLMIRQFPAI